MVTVRNLNEGERLPLYLYPEHFSAKFEHMPLMKDWVWLAEHNGKACGAILAGPCHGVVYLMFLLAATFAPKSTVTTLLRKCMRDCKQRGFLGYVTHVNPTLQTERSLMAISKKAGGMQREDVQVMVIGSLEQAARY